MRCPICKKSVPAEGNTYRPFCSERCKQIDLDNWLSERYRIAEPARTGGQDEGEEDSVPHAEEDLD